MHGCAVSSFLYADDNRSGVFAFYSCFEYLPCVSIGYGKKERNMVGVAGFEPTASTTPR